MAEQGTRLDDAAVQQRLGRLDELIERVEQVPGPTSEAAVEAIQTLAEVYGEALARVMDSAEPPLPDRLVADELVGHLLVLHGLHPKPAEERINEALAEVVPHLGTGGSAELTGIEAGVARIRVSASGCGSAGAAASVADVVLAAAPELAGVDPETVPPAKEAPLIPVDSLLHRPVAT